VLLNDDSEDQTLNEDILVEFSNHALMRMTGRGTTEAEVRRALASGAWSDAQRGKRLVRQTFPFNAFSLVNGKYYAFKTIECIVAVEPTRLFVVTVKVYYGQEERGAP
jgi:Domain of unknown function (DUF4258)